VSDGKQFGQGPTFPLHQTFHIHEKPNALIPNPPEHSANTVQAPYQNGVSTPVSVSVTAPITAPITASVGAPAAADVDKAATELTTAANRAIAERFGEQTDPLLSSSGKAHQFAEAVVSASIPLDFAQRSVARQVLKIDKPVRAMTYFTKGVVDDWAKHNANKAAKNAPKFSPLGRNGELEQSRPLRGGSPPAARKKRTH
jgi:hypothetical protein